MEAGASPPDQELRRIFSPPGLELSDAANEMRAAALEKVEDKLKQIGDTVKRQAVLEAVRQAVLDDVDSKLSERAEELWARGKQMLNQIQQKHKESTSKLTEEVAQCRERQRALEEENEKLKQVIQKVTSRFPQLGFPSGLTETALTSSPASTAAPSGTPQQGQARTSSPASTATPGGTPQLEEAASPGVEHKLPEVPLFPFPAQPQSPAAPLSLAEALGTQTPQRTPLSLVSSLTTTPSSEVATAFMARGTASGAMFSFTLRKADGADLGLNVSHREHDRVLRVEGVRADGAVEAWNRQCAGGACAEKAVLKGDKIISVNSVTYDPDKMLEECRDKQLLKLVIVRGDPPASTIPAKAGPPSQSTGLRADASVFVPMSTDTTAECDEPRTEEDAQTAHKAEGATGRL